MYLDVAPECFDKMQSNINDEDWTQLRVNAHSLKPQAEFMGALDLKQTLVKIEEAVDPLWLRSANKSSMASPLAELFHRYSFKQA